MKQRIYILPLLLSVLLVFNACAAKKRLAALNSHQTMLQRVSLDETMSAEAKMDSLASSFVKMMHEGLDITNPKQGVAYVKQYNTMNKDAINSIIEQITTSTASMDKGDRNAAGLRILGKPYTRELIQLIPRFAKKYAQIKFVSGLTKQVKGGLFSFGGKMFQGLLENL